MRDLLKKVGSSVLGLGALALVLVNAAMTHGCARASNTQASPPPSPSPGAVVEAPGLPAANAASASSANDPCRPPSYMFATKAPVWIPPECTSIDPVPAKAPAESSPSNAARQAP